VWLKGAVEIAGTNSIGPWSRRKKRTLRGIKGMSHQFETMPFDDLEPDDFNSTKRAKKRPLKRGIVELVNYAA